MKIIIAGSRSISNIDEVRKAVIDSGFKISEVVSGRARGVDRLGERWAAENKIPIRQFPAFWEKYGKSAGFLRNKEMVEYADGLIAVWDGKSAGTEHTILLAEKKGLKVHIHYTR